MNFVDSPMIITDGSDSITFITVTKKSGEIVVFSVNVNKNTPAMVKWFHNAASLHSSVDRRVEVSNENSNNFDPKTVWTQDLDASLSINNITCDDKGFYQVEISNPVETTLFTYRLIVEDCKFL